MEGVVGVVGVMVMVGVGHLENLYWEVAALDRSFAAATA